MDNTDPQDGPVDQQIGARRYSLEPIPGGVVRSICHVSSRAASARSTGIRGLVWAWIGGELPKVRVFACSAHRQRFRGTGRGAGSGGMSGCRGSVCVGSAARIQDRTRSPRSLWRCAGIRSDVLVDLPGADQHRCCDRHHSFYRDSFAVSEPGRIGYGFGPGGRRVALERLSGKPGCCVFETSTKTRHGV